MFEYIYKLKLVNETVRQNLIDGKAKKILKFSTNGRVEIPDEAVASNDLKSAEYQVVTGKFMVA